MSSRPVRRVPIPETGRRGAVARRGSDPDPSRRIPAAAKWNSAGDEIRD